MVFTLLWPPVGVWPLYVDELQGYMLGDNGNIWWFFLLVVFGYVDTLSYYAWTRSYLQPALVLPLAKWAVEGAVSVFSFVFPLYVIWHWYMLISRFPALEVYGSVFGALTITAVFEWAEQGCKNLLNYSNFFNSFVLSVTSSSSCQNTFCSCNVAQNYIPTNT